MARKDCELNNNNNNGSSKKQCVWCCGNHLCLASGQPSRGSSPNRTQGLEMLEKKWLSDIRKNIASSLKGVLKLYVPWITYPLGIDLLSKLAYQESNESRQPQQ